jgi:hypothetical protein
MQENFSSFGEYFYYVWSSQRELPGRPGYYQVNVPENGLRVPGKYHAVFMSDTQPYDIMGISDIFEVQGIVNTLLFKRLKLLTFSLL